MTETRMEEPEEIESEIRKTPLTGTKPHSTPLTLKWLEDNYETSEGVCIPRSTLYLHYLEFCQQQDCNPVNAASFGKIIRQQFPQITTRRLGTRGQSKYHYYGIAVRESSPYYDVIYSAKGVQSTGEGKKENTKQLVAYSPRSKLGTLLPPFPDISEMNIPDDMDQGKVMTFLVMYRTHCQRILDTVIRANFDEVENFLHHFWQGMPGHLTPILTTPLLTTVIALCDSILYKTLSEVLIPSVIQPLPESLTQVIGQFADHIDRWVDQAMIGMAAPLKDTKLDLSRQFSQTLRRQLSVNHLVQATRNVLTSSDVITQMLSDWLTIDLGSIGQQTLYAMGMEENEKDRDYPIIWNNIEKLLDTQAPVESYIEWLEDLIETWVAKKTPRNNTTTAQTTLRQFLLLWTCFSSRVIRDMTIQGVPSFGSFHLLHLLLDDYVLYRIQCLNADSRQERFRWVITGRLEEEDVKLEVILPDTSQVTLPLGPFITPPNHHDNMLHPGFFPESLFDYGSSSEFCTSDEDEEDDDDNGGENDHEKYFIPSPFHAFKDNFLQQSHPSPRKDNSPPSFSQCGKAKNIKDILRVEQNHLLPHLPPHRHHHHHHPHHPHHHHHHHDHTHHHQQPSHHYHQPQQPPPSQQPLLNVSHDLPWKMATEGVASPFQNPGQHFIPHHHSMHPHHQQQQQQQQQYRHLHHHQHHQQHQYQHQERQQQQEHNHHNNNRHEDHSIRPPFHKPSDTLITPDLLTIEPSSPSPFHWMSSVTLPSSTNQTPPSFMTDTNTSCKAFSSYQQIPPTCQLATPTTTHIPHTSHKPPAISNQDVFTSQGIMTSHFTSSRRHIQDGRHIEAATPSSHSIGLLG